MLTVAGGVAAFSVSPTFRSWLPFSSPVEAQEGVLAEGGSSGTTDFEPELFFNVPSTFNSLLTAAVLAVEGDSTFGGDIQVDGVANFASDVIIDGQLTLRQNITGNDIDIDLQSGRVIASNLVYSVTAGSGITVSGAQDLVITNNDKGSDQKIFKKIKVGDSTLEADNNSDEVRFSAGSGITLSLSGDEITIAGAQDSGWQRPSSGVVALVTASDKVGIGTASPSNTLEIAAGTDGLSGLTFTNLTSSAAAGVGGGKVLTVDSGGKVILVQDQTGETPDAEDVLPSADTGGTLYFNGLNWVSSTNLFHDGGSVGISNDDPQARLHVNTNSAATAGLIIQGYTGQSANLQEWRDSNGTPLSYIDSSGSFNGSFSGDLNGTVTGTLNPGFTTGAIAFQGADGLNGDATNFFWDNSSKRLGIGTASPQQSLDITGRLRMGSGNIANLPANSITMRRPAVYSNTVGAASSILAMDAGDGSQIFGIGGSDEFWIGSIGSAGRPISLVAGGVKILTAVTGSIGIGTTSPTALLHTASTSTTFPTNGIGYFDWSPTSATTTTGDLFSLNIGANGTVGKLFNVKNNGSSVFSVSQTQITHNVPTQFLAAGDVSFGYDLLLTNATASYLRSYAPMYLEAGDSTGNLDLTLRTWGVGDVIADMGGNFQLQSADPALVFNTATATDTDFWMGVIEDADGVDDDLLQFGKGTVVGTTPYMTMTSTGRLGIGTVTPASSFHVQGNTASGSPLATFERVWSTAGINADVTIRMIGTPGQNDGGVLNLERADGTSSTPTSTASLNRGLGVINARAYDGNSYESAARISFHVDGSGGDGDVPGRMVFSTTPDGTSSVVERMRINNAGNVGIGTTDPGAILDVASPVTTGTGSRFSFNSLTSGNGLYVSTSGTQFTGSLLTLDQTANDAANTGALLTLNTNSTFSKTKGLVINHFAGGTGAAALLVNDQSSDTTPFIIDNDGNVGIGTASPAFKLDVAGDINIAATKSLTFRGNTTPAAHGITDDTSALYFGSLGDLTLSFDTNNNDSASFIIRENGAKTEGTERLRVVAGGAVAIGTSDPGSNKLYVAGDVDFSGSCPGCSSDSRLKTNVETISGSVLTKLLTLKGVTFDWSDAEKARTRPGRQIGVIAQDVEAVFPELVGTDSRGYKFVRYDHLIAPTIEAIREQQTQLISLNGQVLQVNSTLSTLQVNSNGSLTPSPDEQLATRVAALEQQVADLTADKTVNAQGQFEATGLIPGIARWLNNSWTFLASVVFTQSATFEDTATFQKPLAQAQDAVGSIVIPAATDSARISFADAYERAPFVTLTPVSRAVNGYVVDEVSADGFTIRLAQTLEQEVMFNWMAVMSSVAEAPAGLPGVMGVQTGGNGSGAGAGGSNGATGQIIPVSVPLASPSPSPTSLFESTPSSSGSAVIELE